MSALRSATRRMLRRRPEILGDHPHRDAGAAGLAGRPVGDRLAAPEPAVGEQVVQSGRALADQMREHLALLLARQIGARRRRGQVELRRVARMLVTSVGAAVPILSRRNSPPSKGRTVATPSGRPPHRAQRGCARLVVDHDGADQHVVQAAPPLVEQADQQDRAA